MGPTVASRALPHCWISPPSNQTYPCLGLVGACNPRSLPFQGTQHHSTLGAVNLLNPEASIGCGLVPASACITVGLPGVLVKGQKRWPCLVSGLAPATKAGCAA